MSIRVVQGFKIDNFNMKSKNNSVSVDLSADKDDITTQGNIGDVLESLELHSTAADTSSVSIGLRRELNDTTSTAYELSVLAFSVKQDSIKVKLITTVEEDNVDILKSLGIHCLVNRDVEITMERVD